MIQGEIKRHASALALQLGQPRFGIVQSVDTATYTAKVELQPDGVLTSWLPIRSSWIGNGWGLVCPPNAGDQVILIPHDGDADNLVIVGSVYSQQQVPPNGVCGEFWLVHSTGSFVKLENNGNVAVNGASRVNVTAVSEINMTAPTVTITASSEVQMVTPLLTVTGDIVDNSTTNSLTVAGARNDYDVHTHKVLNAQTGSSTIITTVPSPIE